MMGWMRHLRSGIIGAVVGLAIIFSPALAQDTDQSRGHSGLGFGLRGGFGLDPDQFVFGAQYSLGKALKIARFIPSVDLGFGDVTTITFNADLLFRLIVEGSSVGLYGGGGGNLTYFDRNKSSWEPGINVIGGVQLPLIQGYGTSIEGRFGIFDVPDFRLLFVIIF